jgi:hypothetical protein
MIRTSSAGFVDAGISGSGLTKEGKFPREVDANIGAAPSSIVAERLFGEREILLEA